ncbi:response regulator [Nonomuraea sp. NPDC050691]|uniref:response regulator transcription factor n=1 Tax=Nonomuraea sp. NPDC050691 TaxID=3155661 RepID=UPI0033C2AAB4
MIRVLILDEEALVRSELGMILEAAGDIAVVGEASDGEAAVSAVTRLMPHFVLLDVPMPGADGLTAAARVLAAPGSPTLCLVPAMASPWCNRDGELPLKGVVDAPRLRILRRYYQASTRCPTGIVRSGVRSRWGSFRQPQQDELADRH